MGSLPQIPQKIYDTLYKKLKIYDISKKNSDIIENAE